MKAAILKTKLLWGLTLSAVLFLPLANVVACGETTATPAPEEPVVDPEAAAQKAISEAPLTAPSDASLATRILVGLKAVVTKLATAAAVEVPTYLAANKPNFTGAQVSAYLPILTTELQIAYGLPPSPIFTTTELARIMTALGTSVERVHAALQAVALNFDGTQVAATTSWAAQIQFWQYLLAPADNYAHLKAMLKINDAFTDTMIANFETVMTAPQGGFSGVNSSATPPEELLGLGGAQRIFGTSAVLSPTIVARDYRVRGESEIRKAVVFYEPSYPIDFRLYQLNNIFEFNLALGYAFRFKSATAAPIASFWRAKDWGGFADFLAEASFVDDYRYRNTNKVISVYTATLPNLRTANENLIAALRLPTATPQVEFIETTDYTPAAASQFAEDTLTAAGLVKAQPYLDALAKKPLWQALTKANAEYTSQVLGMLAGLSAEQFTALGNWLDALNKELFEFFSIFSPEYGESMFAQFNRSLAVNLWDTTTFTSEPSQAKYSDNNFANFFIQVFTHQFNGPKYAAPEPTTL